jgi:plasmid stability protein
VAGLRRGRLRFTLARALMERLTARAIREGRSVEAVVAEILEGEVE